MTIPFFNKYFVIITSASLIIIGLTGFLRTEFSINTLIFQFIFYSVFASILFIYYLKVGRFYKTLYIKEESLLVLDGYSHKIESISINDIVDLNGYDGIKGYFRYMVFIMGNGKRIYFNPNESANEVFKMINSNIRE